MTWRPLAECLTTDPDLWHEPEQIGRAGTSKEARETEVRRVQVAKSICRRCTVRDECLTEALEAEVDHGIWGGLEPGERRRLGRWSA